MAGLQLTSDMEIALGTAAAGGKAEYTIDPTGTPGTIVEIWERTILFPAAGTSITVPKFTFGGVFSSTTPMSRPVKLGGLYQVLLYEQDAGNEDGTGNVLARRNFPCVLQEGGRSNFLTKCTETPQLDIRSGGTFASLAFAASKLTMARVQLCSDKPFANAATQNLPTCVDKRVVANAVSIADGPSFLHRLNPTDRRILSGSPVFFVILVWDENGNWDYVWHFNGVAPGAIPQSFTTLKRSVEVQLIRLGFIDDSDSSTNGEGDYTLVVRPGVAGTPLKKANFNVATFETNTSLTISPPKTIAFGPDVVTAKTQEVSVQVQGHDDDSGTPFGDDDDFAETDMTALDFPIGETRERVTDQFLSLDSHFTAGDDILHFVADLLFSVNYA